MGVEKAILVGAVFHGQDSEEVKDHLDELAFLAETSGANTVKVFTQNLEHPNPKTFLGKGKIEEIQVFVEEKEIDLVIFDDELSPSQLRNIENALQCKILDRNHLILDIFAKRARTSHAKTQVELAQYQYLLPRLTNLWTHLSKQKGGIGMKGPGETEIETDRRIIRDKISRLKKKLESIDKQKITQRGNRGMMVRVALVGYTNVGKSTLMNSICKSDVFAENKLFATLDTTVRKVVFDNVPFLLSDTVGFIRKLPHQLVESFKSTLDEVKEADILLHVIDVSHRNFEEHFIAVNKTLLEIGAADKPTVLVFNKIDNYLSEQLTEKASQELILEELRNSWMAEMGECDSIFISASKKTNLDLFRSMLMEKVKDIHYTRYPNARPQEEY